MPEAPPVITPATTGEPPETPPASREWTSWTGADGNLNPGWADHLPDDLKPQASQVAALVDKYGGSLPQLLKGTLNLQSIAGRKLAAPDHDWTPEQISEYRKGHGVPEAPDKYDLTPPDGALPEGVTWNPEVFKDLKSWAHKNHVSSAAVKEVASVLAGVDKARQQAAIEMIQQEDTKTINALKFEYGGEWENKLHAGQRAAAVLGIDTDVSTNPIANHPQFIKMCIRAAEKMSESTLTTGAINPSENPADLEYRAIMNDPTHRLYKDYQGDNGPERQSAAQKRVGELIEIANKNKK